MSGFESPERQDHHERETGLLDLSRNQSSLSSNRSVDTSVCSDAPRVPRNNWDRSEWDREAEPSLRVSFGRDTASPWLKLSIPHDEVSKFREFQAYKHETCEILKPAQPLYLKILAGTNIQSRL